MSLTNRVALVTGASSGIGKAIALAFGRAGAVVAKDYVGGKEAAMEVCREIRSMGRREFSVPPGRAELSKEVTHHRLWEL